VKSDLVAWVAVFSSDLYPLDFPCSTTTTTTATATAAKAT